MHLYILCIYGILWRDIKNVNYTVELPMMNQNLIGQKLNGILRRSVFFFEAFLFGVKFELQFLLVIYFLFILP